MRPLLLTFIAAVSFAGEAAPPAKAEVDALIDQGQAWLLTQQQPDGALVPGKTFTLGITAMGALALAVQPKGLAADHPALVKALAYVEAQRKPDGGVYLADEGLGNYTTSLALQLWAATGRKDAAVAAAQRWLLGLQNTEAGNPGEGGIGYGDKGRGHEDLSNTSYAVAALRDSGIPAEDARMQAALKFLERCQDLSSVNKQPWVGSAGGPAGQGGAVYGPAEATTSWEKKEPGQTEKFTSTGTMTYALLSSYLTLQLAPEDPRVTAALAWVKGNYQFAANPGMAGGKELQGLFHYYALMGRTFAMLETPTLTLGDGRIVDWRADLFAAIKAKAQVATLPDGKPGAFWINSAPRWAEGMPHLTTSYMLRGLKAIASTLP